MVAVATWAIGLCWCAMGDADLAPPASTTDLRPPASIAAAAFEPWSTIMANAAARIGDGALRPLASVAAQRVTSTDTLVGNSQVAYADPEIWQDEALMAWQEIQTNQIWLATIHRDTGELIPADGRGIEVAKSVPHQMKWWSYLGNGLQQASLNGPEWGLSQQGLAVYFTFADSSGVLRGGRYRIATGQIDQVTSGGSSPQRGFLASTDAADARARLLYFHGRTTLTNQTVMWKYEDAGETHRVPMTNAGTSGLRWIPGRHACTTNVDDPRGVVQVGEYDLLTDRVTLLTQGPEDHHDAYTLSAPDSTSLAWMTCIEGRNRVAVYRFEGGRWVKHRLLTPPVSNARRVTVAGVKPLWHQGRPLVTYTLHKSLPYLTNSVICLADTNGEFNQVVSSTTDAMRTDPEAFSGNSSLFIYYYLLENPVGRLRRIQVDIEP